MIIVLYHSRSFLGAGFFFYYRVPDIAIDCQCVRWIVVIFVGLSFADKKLVFFYQYGIRQHARKE